jgi:2'-5' RNA ligase
MRTFLCLPIDSSTREALGTLSEELRQLVQVRASWVPAENLHVTVRFLGEIDPMLTVELEQICRPVAGQIAPFDLSIDRLGVFPAPERPRVLWAGGEAPSVFHHLVSSINEGLSQLGFPEERKKPVAHVTLARIKGRADRSIMQAINSLVDQLGWTLRVNKLVLMESRLTSHGAVYNPLFTLTLGGGDAV